MRKVKLFLAILLVAVFGALNTSILIEDAEAARAGGQLRWSAGTKIYDSNGAVVGCDCPAVSGNCICDPTPNPY